MLQKINPTNLLNIIFNNKAPLHDSRESHRRKRTKHHSKITHSRRFSQTPVYQLFTKNHPKNKRFLRLFVKKKRLLLKKAHSYRKKTRLYPPKKRTLSEQKADLTEIKADFVGANPFIATKIQSLQPIFSHENLILALQYWRNATKFHQKLNFQAEKLRFCSAKSSILLYFHHFRCKKICQNYSQTIVPVFVLSSVRSPLFFGTESGFTRYFFLTCVR